MQTLSYGYQLPDNGDKGTALWTALDSNITQLNSHSHNGSDSAKITASNLSNTVQSITNSGWSASGTPGMYRQSVSMAAGYTWDNFKIEFRDASSGEKLLLTTAKIDNFTFYVYTNDNTLSLKAVYGC